jgi:hypothetical protein
VWYQERARIVKEVTLIGKWNYENYTKAIVPLLFAIGTLLTGWVETGGLEKAEINNVITLLIVAAIVFLAPNQKMSREEGPLPNDPNLQQGDPGRHAKIRSNSVNYVDTTQTRVQPDAPIAEQDQPTTRVRKRRGPLKEGE